MKALLVLLSMLLATVASAQSLGVGYLSGSGQPGYAVELTSTNAAGVYYLGPSTAMTYAEVKLGSALRGTLYNCFAIDADAESNGAGDGTVDTSAKCTAILGLGGDGNASLVGGGRYLHVDIDTAESGSNRTVLVVRGSNTLSQMTEEEMCAAGLQGFGYSVAQRRWKKPCADFNWDGWRDSSQMNASYVTTCTGEGQPEETCLYAGDKVYHGFGLHRLALALQYAADGGKVIALDHPYSDDGAGLIQGTATRAKFPRPFDPEWEARPEFPLLGYPTTLNAILYNRGVTLEGAGAPRVLRHHPARPEITDQTPLYLGSWLIDNRGLSGSLGAFDGELNNIENPNYYRNLIGWSPYNTYCNTTSNTNPACNVNVEDERLKMPGSNVYGYESPILANYTDTGTIGYLCVNDTVSGSSQANATGMCQGNRMVLCWNGGAASGRNVGGCIFDTDSDGDFTSGDTGNLNLGACESFHDSLQYDRATRGQEIQLALALPHCPDDATSSTDCTTGISAPGAPSTPFIGWNQTLVNISSTGVPGSAGAWTGPFAQMGAACGAGGAWVETASVAGLGGSAAFPAENRRTYYLGSPYMTVRAVSPDKYDARYAGPRNFGFAPSSWYGRNSSNANGDCLSGGDISSANDEPNCDTETQLGHASVYNGWSEGNLFFRASYSAGKSGISETYPGGGPNYFVNNTVLDHLRGTGFDWGEGAIRGLSLNGFGVGIPNSSSPGYSNVVQCYSDDCVVEDSVFRRVKTTNFYQFVVFTTNNIVRRNQYEQVHVAGDAFYLVRDSGVTTIEGERYSGINANAAPMLKVEVGYGSIQKPSVTFRGNSGIISTIGFANSAPAAVAVVQSAPYNTTRSDLFRQIIISDNNLFTKDSNACLLWLEDDCSAASGACTANDAAALTRESAPQISVLNNSLVGPGTPDVLCAGGYRTSGVLNDASNDRNIAHEDYLPIAFGNRINNGASPINVTQLVSSEAGLDADNLPDGTRVTVFNGTAGCGHANGDLTNGTVRITCVAHPNTSASAIDGTWSVD